MKTRLIVFHLLICIVATVSVSTAGDEPLKTLAKRRGILLGTNTRNRFWTYVDRENYEGTIKREFASITPGNALKFGPLHREPDGYDFSRADRHVKFAENHGLKIHGHVLVWHRQLPLWVKNRNWTRDELVELLRKHIHTVVGRYKGRIPLWDVVNEAVAYNQDEGFGYRDTLWYSTIGPQFIELAFRFAHQADPDARLIYNDFDIEEVTGKANFGYTLVKDLLDRGTPIHGIGFQMHIKDKGFNTQSFARNIRRFAKLGLEIHITEMDVSVREPATQGSLKKQASVYHDVVSTCSRKRACKSITFWGFTDRHSWIPRHTKGERGSALLFDEAYQPKPAYYAVRKALK